MHMALILTTFVVFFSSEAFVPPFHRSRQTTIQSNDTATNAKNTKKKQKKRRSGRGKPMQNEILPQEEEVKKKLSVPARIRKQTIELSRETKLHPLRVCTFEVDDVEWWENHDNPYGGRLWPSALAISEFLVGLGRLDGYEVLELGCGAGLTSIVAAECGAQVVASDISSTAIQLCQKGWRETQNQRPRQQSQHGKKDDAMGNNAGEITLTNKPGSLETVNLDLLSNEPLPISNRSTNPKLVIATAMMYQADLAEVLARRAFEACERGAWVIIGDDDTGMREGGRELFVSELDALEQRKGVVFTKTWTNSIVKSTALQWKRKQVNILHLNPPASVLLDDSVPRK